MSELARLTAAAEEAEETVVEERRRRVWPEMWFLKGRKREKDLR